MLDALLLILIFAVVYWPVTLTLILIAVVVYWDSQSGPYTPESDFPSLYGTRDDW
jgi:hypothetical protein